MSRTSCSPPRTCGDRPAKADFRSPRSARLATLLDAVPPGADAGHEMVVALDHLDGLALAVLGGLDAEAARLLFLFRRHPAALVPPQAWAELPVERLPDVL